MEYLQLKLSVERLTESLKIIPKEDSEHLTKLLNKYKEQMKSIKYFNEKNTSFSKEEINNIKRYVSNLKNKILPPYQEKIDLIEDKINEISGFNKANKKEEEVVYRIFKIAEWMSEKYKIYKSFYYVKTIQEKSSVYKKIAAEYNRKASIATKMCEDSKEYNEAVIKYVEIENMLENFEIDLELKNLIAHRFRNRHQYIDEPSIDFTIRESIHIEIEKQWNKFFNQLNQ